MASSQVVGMQDPAEKPKNNKIQGLERQQKKWGLIFLSPWIVGFTLFTAAPILISFYWTFTDFTLGTNASPTWIGIENWQRLFTDSKTLLSLTVTLRFAAIALPIAVLLPLGMAALLNAKYLWGKSVWRTLFYMPYMVPAVSGIFVWRAFLNGQTGWLNRMLRILGLESDFFLPALEFMGFERIPNWLEDERTLLFAFLLIGIWGSGNAMLTMLASMQGVPSELYDAADVDGASAWMKFSRITIPMISPVIFYNLVLAVIGLMQYFTVPYIVTDGVPTDAAFFYNIHFYKTAFTFGDMGYGATLAWFIFIIALIFTIILFMTSGKWVFYAGGDE